MIAALLLWNVLSSIAKNHSGAPVKSKEKSLKLQQLKSLISSELLSGVNGLTTRNFCTFFGSFNWFVLILLCSGHTPSLLQI